MDCLALAVITPEEIESQWRLMGLDVGDRTIGLANAEPGLWLATPLETIARKKFTADATTLFALVDKHDTDALVIGLPINMDGSEGPRCQSVQQFAANLLAQRDIPIAFWDERLSTAAVTRAMIQADVSRKNRAQAVDKLAAAYILQGALDFLHR